ncbi:hypothetical protein Cfor_02813 [Coptotermes formosanus]|jgi:hypothetical protein|uniref:GIY-YIG domain-containing protein n=1 Tax=Coptotermes formosanus TaxID=36987 RepID=A0A6L2Q1N0_COPFO|nr:hypothetical protein Cfor_02813 [Coptotermes formosanus]
MGAPSSAILSEFFLQYIESNQIINILTKNKILGCFRYIGDILILYDHTSTDINNLLNELNQIHQNIIYTLEPENNRQINFLDVTISTANEELKFNIYRKPTYTDTIIPYSSCHPTQQKLAALRYFSNRPDSYPLEQEEKDKEKTIIQNIAHNNGFPSHIINKFINKPPPQITNTTPKTKNKNNKKLATLTYVGKETCHISKIFKNSNIRIAYKNRSNLQHLLNQKTDKKDIYEQSGVYQLTCSDCKKTYTRQTGSNFEKRFKEHLQA